MKQKKSKIKQFDYKIIKKHQKMGEIADIFVKILDK